MIYMTYFDRAGGSWQGFWYRESFTYAKTQHGVREIQIVFPMTGEYNEFYGCVVRKRCYGFVINPLLSSSRYYLTIKKKDRVCFLNTRSNECEDKSCLYLLTISNSRID